MEFIPYPSPTESMLIDFHSACSSMMSPQSTSLGLSPKFCPVFPYSNHLINRQTDSRPWVALPEDDAQQSPSGLKEFMHVLKRLFYSMEVTEIYETARSSSDCQLVHSFPEGLGSTLENLFNRSSTFTS